MRNEARKNVAASTTGRAKLRSGPLHSTDELLARPKWKVTRMLLCLQAA